ncbi:MAG TPA: hypothetical protein VLF17_00785 [Candidatus Nitrosotenuis sp.]|nr:hypothetical protein [Candidatus Nitrosotenuis sp.]
MSITNRCIVCEGQLGVSVTCAACKHGTEYICTRCLNVEKTPCTCFEVRKRFDFLR